MLVAILFSLLLVAVIAVTFTYGFRFVTSEPNEWMLVIRNGKVITSGVGISSQIYFGDKVVKFPSRINKVNFTAQQVTNEMQGVEVTGIIVWAIYRDNEGPVRAFKMLGDDLKKEVPTTANSNLVEMASSIVRHRIANSSIDEIIKNRSVIREEVRKEMNNVVNGWGVWLETVEITDVKILSSSLFSNLQTEFREEQRQKAEFIRMRTENDLEEKRIIQQLDMSKKTASNQTQKSIYKLNQEFKVKEEQQLIYKKDQEIQKQRVDSELQIKLFKLSKDNEYQDKVNQKNHNDNIKNLELEGFEEKKRQEVNQIREETCNLNLKGELAKKQKKADHELEMERQDLEMKREIYKKTPFEYHTLNTIKEIYKSLPIREVKVLNMGGNSQDLVGNMIGQVFSSIKEIRKQ